MERVGGGSLWINEQESQKSLFPVLITIRSMVYSQNQEKGKYKTLIELCYNEIKNFSG